MKKVNLAESLELSKEIIANLTDEQLQQIEGGEREAAADSCWFNSCITNSSDLEESAQ